MAKSDPSRNAPDEIDGYLAAQPADIRAELERMRSIVRETAPGCTERVSYGIPIFRLRKDLVGLSGHATHCSLHVMSPRLVEAMADALKAQGVEFSGATIHFTPEAPLPRDLIEKIVRRRMQEVGA